MLANLFLKEREGNSMPFFFSLIVVVVGVIVIPYDRIKEKKKYKFITILKG